MSSAPNAFFRSHACEFYAEALSTPAFDELGTHRLHWSWSVVRIQIRLTCEIFSILYCAQWQWNGQVVKRLNLNLNVGSHAQVHRRSQLCFVSYQGLCMYLPERVAILIFSGGKKTCCSEGVASFVLLVNKNAHVFARGGGNCELFLVEKENMLFRGVASLFCQSTRICMYLPEGVAILNCFWWKKGTCCFRGVAIMFLLVSSNMHVFARGVGNFELPSNHDIVVQKGSQVLFCSLTRLCMYLPERVAIFNGSGGKRNVFFRGVEIMFC